MDRNLIERLENLRREMDLKVTASLGVDFGYDNDAAELRDLLDEVLEEIKQNA